MKSILYAALLLLIIGIGSNPAIAEEGVNVSRETKLAELFQTAYENNPEIIGARSEWRASVAMYPSTTSLPDPSLLLRKPLNGSSDYELELMQMIPNPRFLQLRGKRALTMSEMARIKFEKTVRDVLVDVMKSYYELGYLERATTVTKTNHELFTQLVDLARLRNSTGEIGASELYSAESRLAQSEYELILLSQLREAEMASMRKLLNLNPDSNWSEISLPLFEPIPLDLDTLRKSVTEHNQELSMAGLSVELGNIDVSLAKSMQIPDFSLGLMYGRMSVSAPMTEGDMEATASMTEEEYKIMFGITLPIWGGKNKSMINEAREKRNALEASYKNQSNKVIEATDRLYWKILNLERLAKLYKDSLLPQARTASQTAQTLYEQGRSGFSELLETRLVVGNFETASARAQADYLQALAELARLTGTPVFESESKADETIEEGRESK